MKRNASSQMVASVQLATTDEPGAPQNNTSAYSRCKERPCPSVVDKTGVRTEVNVAEVLFSRNELRVHAGTDASNIKSGPPALAGATRLGGCLLGDH